MPCVLQALTDSVSTLSAHINTLQTQDGGITDTASTAAVVPFITQPATGRKLLSQSHLSSGQHPPARDTRLRALQVASAETPYFDVNGDGVFDAADYILFVQLGLAWSNDFADAGPWLQEFRRLTGSSDVSDWQLQSTDPDFMCVPLLGRVTGPASRILVGSAFTWTCFATHNDKSILVKCSVPACSYFSGDVATGLPWLARPDGSTRPEFEARLLEGSAIQSQYYQQYVRPATQRAFKQMQVWPKP
jgi:hypothetical protein